MFLSFEQVAVAGSVLDSTAFTIPPKASGVDLQADTNDIRYTMDNVTPPSGTAGMLLLVTEPPRYFEITDLKRIKIIGDGGAAAKLNVHYHAGRDI